MSSGGFGASILERKWIGSLQMASSDLMSVVGRLIFNPGVLAFFSN